ncbi:hypothetical protein BJ742DRAFT_846012 [Cladochytrium replicatum]|nr:hypothetical protein BJ742DRAFT_846012 [Cladochytrium replicatum]
MSSECTIVVDVESADSAGQSPRPDTSANQRTENTRSSNGITDIEPMDTVHLNSENDDQIGVPRHAVPIQINNLEVETTSQPPSYPGPPDRSSVLDFYVTVDRPTDLTRQWSNSTISDSTMVLSSEQQQRTGAAQFAVIVDPDHPVNKPIFRLLRSIFTRRIVSKDNLQLERIVAIPAALSHEGELQDLDATLEDPKVMLKRRNLKWGIFIVAVISIVLLSTLSTGEGRK